MEDVMGKNVGKKKKTTRSESGGLKQNYLGMGWALLEA